MIPSQRRQRLLELLEAQTVLSIAELVERLAVSHMTVRRDIQQLEQEGRVLSVTGGVRLVSHLHREPSWQAKAVTNLDAKRAIARRAAQMVHDGLTVYLDAGTTLYEMATLVTHVRHLTVITNNFQITAWLAQYPHIDLYHAGGRVDHDNHSSVGPSVVDYLRQVNVDIAFISSSSWHLERGVTTPDEAKLMVKQQLMRSASRRVLLADSAKYGQFGLFRACSLEDFDLIVTDSALAPLAQRAIVDRGIALACVADTEGAPPVSNPDS
ncbi:DeoR/GlpR family DNA-binding transcription regulator [Salinicola halophilus]|uniref:DeoR/GlpR family DNA-binding transcription regulator n=1 Tax=Salinicola halophilus TaxID=184065 RepID=UPI000DA12353|nr:DeoR/GlpR family DNA-binding transcription regulator [Salinicola halophilus]